MAKGGRKSGGKGTNAAGSGGDVVPEQARNGVKPGGASTRRKAAAGEIPLTDFRHAAKRKNNPPAKIAAEGAVPAIPRAQYAYNPHLPPVLRFDATGGADRLPALLAKARTGPLSEEEAQVLADALRLREPWLEWTGKRERKSFEVDPVALHIHERISAQAILKVAARQDVQRSLFADPEQDYHEAVQFYRHDVDWANRLILGDSLQVMSSLARREDLAGKVQMIYMDPPYGIKFASNFQPEVGRRDVKDQEQDLTREPEMVRAYRDTWHLGVHSYLSYLRDRLIVARELLADTGSIFVQISDENLHRVRLIFDEVFGSDTFLSIVTFQKTGGAGSPSAETQILPTVGDFLLWYCRDHARVTHRQVFRPKPLSRDDATGYQWLHLPTGERRTLSGEERNELEIAATQGKIYKPDNLTSQSGVEKTRYPIALEGAIFRPLKGVWKTGEIGMSRLLGADRVVLTGDTLKYVRYFADFVARPMTNIWDDTVVAGFGDPKVYVVQTNAKVIERCMLMTTDPGDLVLDPTCGSGATAYVAEQWGRRWITIDTSRVAVAIARQRLLTAKYDMYRVRDPQKGGKADPSRQNPGAGFLYKTVPHITLKSIAQNTALDPIFARHEPLLERALAACNAALPGVSAEVQLKLLRKLANKERTEGKRSITDADRRRWLLPPMNREAARAEDAAARKRGGKSRYTVDLDFAGWYAWEVPFDVDADWPKDLQDAVLSYRAAWRAKMDEVNACIAASAEQEELVDQPEVIRGVTRVSGPFTVEAVQPPELTLSDNIDPRTGRADPPSPGGTGVPPVSAPDDPTAPGFFGGEPDALPDGFVPRTLRVVEPRNEFETANVAAYLDQMFRFLKADGVRFLNNKQARWTRFEPLFESGKSGGFHAEGRWAAGPGDDADPDAPSNVAVVFGPQYGPVTAAVVEQAIRSATRKGYEHLLVAAFSFDGAATGVLSEADAGPGVFGGRGGHQLHVHFAHIRPDINPGMNGLLKESPQPGAGQLFSVFGLPRIAMSEHKTPDGRLEYVVEMQGVDIYNPVSNSISSTGAEKVAAWFLDGDYDGRTFCVTQAFFPDRSAWEKLARALNGKDGPIDAERFEAFSGTMSLPFPAGKHGCVAVKVIDPRGNEVMTVEKLASQLR